VLESGEDLHGPQALVPPSQEMKATRPRRNHVRQPPVVDHHRVPVPEGDGRQIARQNLLRFDVIGAAPVRIGALGRLASACLLAGSSSGCDSVPGEKTWLSNKRS